MASIIVNENNRQLDESGEVPDLQEPSEQVICILFDFYSVLSKNNVAGEKFGI